MGMTDKEHEFITAVQTMIILHALEGPPDAVAPKRADASVAGLVAHVHDAYAAAKRIPEHLSAREAAGHFYDWTIRRSRDQGGAFPGWLLSA